MVGQIDKLLFLLILASITIPVTYLAILKSTKLEWILLVAALVTSTLTTRLGVTFLAHDAFYRGTVFGYTIQVADLIYLPFFLRAIVNKPPLETQVLGGIYLLFCAIVVISAWAAPVNEHGYSDYAIFEIIKLGLVLGVFANHVTERTLEALVVALLIIATFHGMSFLWDRYVLGVYRVSAFLHHPNLMGSFVVLVSMPLLFLLAAPQRRSIIQTFVLAIPALLISLGAILSVSRSALALMIVGVFCILLYVALRRANRALRWGLLLFALAIPIAFKAADTFIERLESTGLSGGGREEMDALAITMGLDHFTGVGINNYSLAARSYDTEHFAAVHFHDDLPPAHNAFLLMMAETGVVGMILFSLLFIFPLIQGGIAQHRMPDTDWRKYFLLGMILATCLLLLQSMLEDSLRRGAIMYLLFPYLGVLTAAPAMLKRERLNGLAPA
ncbi:MAG TPA: O-antigen ligase domain-containing protein [Gammaproteobacteria bacterium]|nr:O-antigen ligase domain-containing protein [Gammaproteobacteria bacterium]